MMAAREWSVGAEWWRACGERLGNSASVGRSDRRMGSDWPLVVFRWVILGSFWLGGVVVEAVWFSSDVAMGLVGVRFDVGWRE